MEEPIGEDENKVQLDEIKEVVEEKYIKEETKEDKLEEVKSKIEQPSTLPKEASPRKYYYYYCPIKKRIKDCSKSKNNMIRLNHEFATSVQ